MDELLQIRQILPPEYRRALEAAGPGQTEELRLRVGRPPTALTDGAERVLPLRTGFGLVTRQDAETIVMNAARQSAYAAADTLREGYVTLEGGHRIGVCGTAVTREGEICGVRELSSICIRVARTFYAKRSQPLPLLTGSTLVLGPPGSGKTTLLRDLIRLLSDSGRRVSVADERGELAACWQGSPQRDLGARTDVLTGGRKSEALLRLLRTMNPQWLAADEITAPEDLAAMEQCSYCGVLLLASAHAGSASELEKRPLYRRLLELKIFEQTIRLLPDRTFQLERMA